MSNRSSQGFASILTPSASDDSDEKELCTASSEPVPLRILRFYSGAVSCSPLAATVPRGEAASSTSPHLC